jgi:hypothetical protein
MLTIATFFEILLKVIVDAKALNPIPLLVVILSTVLRPLEEDLD